MKNITATEFEELFEYQNGSPLLHNNQFKLLIDDSNRCFYFPKDIDPSSISQTDISYFQNNNLRFDRVLDIGAGLGHSTVEFAKISNAVSAFEAGNSSFDCLDSNLDIAVNTYAKEIRFNRHNVAVTNSSLYSIELVEFEKDYTKNSIKLNEEEYADVTDMYHYILLKQQTVDSYKFNDVGLINIDVNGYEFKVLQGAKETIKNCSPYIMINLKENALGQYRDTVQDVIEFLLELDYQEVSTGIFSRQ